MLKQLLFFILVGVSMTGCGAQIADFVGSRPSLDLVTPSTSTSNPIGSKISPGAGLAVGTSVKSRFAITPSQFTAQGSTVSSKYSFHQNRPN